MIEFIKKKLNKDVLIMSKYDLWVIDKDNCPDDDVVIMNGQCTSCEHYKGFKMVNSQRCIICSFCENNNTSEEIAKEA